MSLAIPGVRMGQPVDCGFYHLRIVVRFSLETDTCLFLSSAHTEPEAQLAAYPPDYSCSFL
jgi:hypothetical protein